MKILTVVHNFPPAFTGGTERVAELLALEMTKRGHEVHVFCGGFDREPEARVIEEERDGIAAVTRFLRSTVYRSPIDTHDPDCESAFESVLRTFRPDVMHLHHWEHLSTGLVAIAARNGVPAVVTLHDYATTCALLFRLPNNDDFCDKEESAENCLPCLRQHRPEEESELVHALDMRFRSMMSELSLSAAILISGHRQLENMARFGRFPRSVFEKVKLLPLGVVPPGFLAKREFVAKPEGVITVGHWGNLSRVKGLEVLVQAAARSRHARRLKLKLIGELKDTQLQANLHEAAGAARIEILGRYEAATLPQLISDVDVAVFPSLCEETHSIVLDEALLSGLPVIVSDRGAMASRVGDRGIVVPANNVAALSRALDKMVDDKTRGAYAKGACGEVVNTAEYAAMVEEVYSGLSPVDPNAPILDLGRVRHSYRNRRFVEVGQFALALAAQRRNIDGALSGDVVALEELRQDNADLATRIEQFLKTTREDHHDD